MSLFIRVLESCDHTWLTMSNDTYHNLNGGTLCLVLLETHGIIWLAKMF